MAYGLFNNGGYYGGTPGMNTAPVYGFHPQQEPAQQQQNVGILWVQGESGAKSYLVAPGNTVQLMDSEVPRFYIKTTGADGMPQPLRKFKYEELFDETGQQTPARTANAVTREEYEILNGKFDELTKIVESCEMEACQAHEADNQRYKSWLKSIGAESTSLKIHDKYLDAKYNNSEEYQLLDGYGRAVEKGYISPLIGFDQYLTTAAEIKDKLVGITTANGMKVKDCATHFIDRVIGQVSESHSGKRRGVSINDVLDCLLHPDDISEVYVKNGDKRQNFVRKTTTVTISVTESKLIQTNPIRRNKKAKNERQIKSISQNVFTSDS